MKSRPDISVLLTVLALLLTANAQAQATNPAYLSQMPLVERVKTEIKGADAMETAARQMGAYWQLQQIIETLAGQRYYRNQLTPDETRLIGQYRGAYDDASMPYEHIQNSPSHPDKSKWYQLHAFYETDPGFRDELLKRFCSTEVRTAYYRATEGQPTATQRAQPGTTAVTDPAKEDPRLKAGKDDRTGKTEAEVPTSFFEMIALLLLLPFTLLYFAPTIVAWRRTRADQSPALPLWLLFVLNLVFGVTTIGWLLLWPFALGWWKLRSGGLGGSQQGWGTPNQGWKWETPEQKCSHCNGQGETCPACLGSRGKYELPQGEHGSSQWVSCSYCLGKGRIQCRHCGAFPL